MTTHQELTGDSDEDLVKRYTGSYGARFTDAYWRIFDERVVPRVSPSPTIVDLGCGPALFLRDAAARFSGASVYGYDLMPAMIDAARTLDIGDATGTFEAVDLVNDFIPLDDGAAEVVAMTQVLHLFTDPFALLDEVRRVLKPDGLFLLYDFVRTSFPEYIDRSSPGTPDKAEARKRMMVLYAVHNKYSVDDWEWMLGESGFAIEAIESPRERFTRLFIATPTVRR